MWVWCNTVFLVSVGICVGADCGFSDGLFVLVSGLGVLRGGFPRNLGLVWGWYNTRFWVILGFVCCY